MPPTATSKPDDVSLLAAPLPPAESKPIVEVKNLGIWYRLHKRAGFSLKEALLTGAWRRRPPLLWALRHVDLACYEGQALGVIGHNGAGKSTLCLALSGILVPDEGSVAIRGKVSPLLRIGTGFNANLTGRANILLNAAFLGIPRPVIEEKMEQIIEFSELGDFIDEPVQNYSTGMRSRLAFSVAATIEPEIMILDEVLSAGDQAFKAKSQQRIQELMEQSRLIVIVSHSTSFLRRVCTHCLWLDHGRVRAYDEAPAVLKQYKRAMARGDGAQPARNLAGANT